MKHTLCTQRSVNGRELKSSASSAILKQSVLALGRGTDVVDAVALESRMDSLEGPACVSLLISFLIDKHFFKEGILTHDQ